MTDMERTNIEANEGARPPAEAPRPAAPRRAAAPKKPPVRRGVNVSDPVGDMLASRLKAEIARILQAEGYITGYEKAGDDLVVRLKYQGRKAVLMGIDRMSRPGRRIYAQKTEMPRVLGGLGIAIVSTSAGLMNGTDARKRGLGR